MSHRFVASLAVAFVCVAPACKPVPGTGDGTDDATYRYVLGVDEGKKAEVETLYGGAHEVVVPRQRDVREAIDEANRPSRLHPELTGPALKYDAQALKGETDHEVFASTWWAQSNNGISKRWTGGSQDYSKTTDKDKLSPSEKYDSIFFPGQTASVTKVEHWDYKELKKDESKRAKKHTHPETSVAGPTTKWELENHGVYQTWAHPDSWWGHCNGWSSYATAEAGGYPKRDIRVKLVDNKIRECAASDTSCVLFRMGDIEALMSELYFSDQSTMAGRRCEQEPTEMPRDKYGRPEDVECRDLNAGSLHSTITGLLNKGVQHKLSDQSPGKPAFVIDYNYDYEVWNYPLVKYEVKSQKTITEAEANKLVGDAGSDYVWNTSATKFVQVKTNFWMISDGVDDSKMLKRADQRGIEPQLVTINYVLELDAQDNILGGEWIADPAITSQDSKKLHPDFYWMAVKAQGYGEGSDDQDGDNDNPFLHYSKVKALLECANDATTCDEDAPAPTTGASCEDNCGSTNGITVDDKTCYCDSVCMSYGDCCGDYKDECGAPTTEPTPTGATCEGHCGQTAPAAGSNPACYCDDACEGFGDCCGDYSTECAQ